jgi:pimeloyl-ACP methyl ester carboxylesterase
VLELLKNKGIAIEIWHSKDDFVVPFSAARAYKSALPSARTRFFEDKNHFLIAQFPELVDAILGRS